MQNLHILLLINKYGLEENRPFKKDPGALKTTNHFMDELCISAVVEDRPAPGFLSPQTPRSKDLDPAKKFFIRAVARYYGPALPKVVEKLSVKCGVETSLLKSPRPSRGSKRAGLQRSVSMGILQKPNRLDLTAATQTATDGPLSSSSATTPRDEVVAPKHGFPMSRQSTSDNPARSALDSIFRNRQVAMTRGAVKGRSTISSSTGSSSASVSSANVQSSQGRSTGHLSQPQARPPSQRSKSMNSILDDSKSSILSDCHGGYKSGLVVAYNLTLILFIMCLISGGREWTAKVGQVEAEEVLPRQRKRGSLKGQFSIRVISC